MPSMWTPILAIAAFTGCLLTAIVVPRVFFHTRSFLFALDIIFLGAFFLTIPNSLHPLMRYQSSIAYLMAPLSMDYVFFTDVQAAFFAPGQTGPITNTSLVSRMVWALQLLCNPRGIGWSFEPRGVFRRWRAKGTTAASFVVAQVRVIAQVLAMLVVASIYVSQSPGFDYGTRSQPWIWRFGDTAAVACLFYVLLQISDSIQAIFRVVMGYLMPENYVKLTGPWEKAYSVKNLWGRVWQQLLRRALSSPGKFLAQNIFCLPRGSSAAYYIQLYIAFGISGMTHGLGDVMMDGNWHAARSTLMFFICQASVIVFEDCVGHVARRMGVREEVMESLGWRQAGYLWVFLVQVAVMPMWFEHWILAGRVKNVLGMPSIILQGLWKGASVS